MTDSITNTAFPKESRLLRSSQFRHVFDCKLSVADQVLIVYGALNNGPQSRLGLAVSRKVGNAVVRNRWKRQIREAFRLQQSKIPSGVDLVVLPRRGASPDHAAIRQSLYELTVKLERRFRKDKHR